MTGLILAVDTTNEYGSLALSDSERLLQEVTLHAPNGYSEILFASIEQLLAANNVTIRDVALFASSSGPGTFTGVRVSLSCVKGLAQALRKSAAAVSNLEVKASLGTAPLRAVTLDARRGEIYAAIYDSSGAIVVPEHVTTMSLFQSERLTRTAEFVHYDGPLAAAISRIAHRHIGHPAALEANYIRRSDAELHLTSSTFSRSTSE